MASLRSLSIGMVATVIAIGVMGAAACGDILDNAPSDDSNDAAGNDGSERNDGGSLGEVGEAPCKPDESPPPAAIYVSEKSGAADASAAAGTATSPFKSLTAAINLAHVLGGTPTIIVDEGTYAEAVELDFLNGVVMDGAWTRTGAAWTRDCSKNRREKTLIQSPGEIGVRVKSAKTTPIVISNFTIVTAAVAAPVANMSGGSRYGIFVEEANLRLENVTVQAAAGGPGGEASKGANGTALCVAQPPQFCPVAPTMGIDTPAASFATIFGSFDPTMGFVPGDGFAGTGPGTAGSNGTPGGAANTATNCETGCSASDNCASHSGNVTSSPGQCGCGGGPGQTGNAGRGGGASIALFVNGANATVIVKWSELVAGNGGGGSPGGAGGLGGSPTLGVAGAADVCYQPKTCVIGTCPGCGCYCKGNWYAGCSDKNEPTQVVVGGGTAGGPGMAGGAGSAGGGGGGGPSYSIVALAGAQVVVTESKRVFGGGGLGAGGAPAGPSGEKP